MIGLINLHKKEEAKMVNKNLERYRTHKISSIFKRIMHILFHGHWSKHVADNKIFNNNE